MSTTLGNFFIKMLIKSPLHPLLGDSYAVITVTGCKTGRPITTSINTVYVDGILSVVSMRERTWWRNLRKESLAWLDRAGKRLMVRGEIVETPDQVISIMEKYFAQYPGFMKYFKLPSGPDGKPETQELKRLASKRVIVHLFPVFR